MADDGTKESLKDSVREYLTEPVRVRSVLSTFVDIFDDNSADFMHKLAIHSMVHWMHPVSPVLASLGLQKQQELLEKQKMDKN